VFWLLSAQSNCIGLFVAVSLMLIGCVKLAIPSPAVHRALFVTGSSKCRLLASKPAPHFLKIFLGTQWSSHLEMLADCLLIFVFNLFQVMWVSVRLLFCKFHN